MNEKIAILTDSGSDVPKNYIDKYNNIYVAPLLVNYEDKTYKDTVDIFVDEVCDRLTSEIPKTSLPTITMLEEIFQKIVDDGYNKVVICPISSGLSGTFNAMRIVGEEFASLEKIYVDTKNIGIGSGLTAMKASELIAQGVSFNELEEKLLDNVENCKVFFCVKTLEYLQKGGRIGLVTAKIGTKLDLKPIISCNEEGVYYTVAKARGRKKSLIRALEEARKFADKYEEYNIAVASVGAEKESAEIEAAVKEHFHNVKEIYISSVSPALVVHTGPGLLGIGIQKIK